MFERFTKEARAIVTQAEQEARALGDRTIEAEHLLLALARGAAGTDAVATTLAGAGLDVDGLREALDAEQTRSLAAVGIDPAAFALPDPPPRRRGGSLRFGTSAKVALERTLRAAVARSDRHIGASHVLAGVLAADHGRVPRALDLAGVDRASLAAAV